MIYYTGLANQNRRTAGAKAPSDILELCRRRKYRFIEIKQPDERWPKPVQQAWKYAYAIKYWMSVLNKLKKGDVFIYQHPLYVSRLLPKFISKFKEKGIKMIVLIHDLETLRKGIEGAVNANESANKMIEGRLLKKFDGVICHNERMKKHLVKRGYSPDKVVCLEIFDYLTDCKITKTGEKGEEPSLAVAGNLLRTKSGYIYHIHDSEQNKGLKVHLFGLSFDETVKNDDLIYHGSFPAAELPEALAGDFGLVWDGLEASTCAGHVGEYLRYNNPHKTSLYLASGLPVIIWSKAAMAEFILKNKLGIAIDDLADAKHAIEAVTQEEYAAMCENVRKISSQLRSGKHFYNALDKLL